MENPALKSEELLGEIAAAQSPDELEQVRVKLIGRNGAITLQMRGLGQLPAEQRRSAGAALNSLRDMVTAALEEAGDRLRRAALANRLAGERADVTLPVLTGGIGTIHPISQTIDEIIAIFGEMGFIVAEGPHIEDDFHNFTALNIPPEHPARQEHDTFYLPQRPDGMRLVLRTHTSPVQIRTMQARKPPLRIIVPGRTFRCDHDATHSPMFHQVEGLVIDRTSHMGHLKGCLVAFCRAFFETEDVPVRFRPSYFPFTEPSVEFDASCVFCGGSGTARTGGTCGKCKGAGWIELFGAGMVDPTVYGFVNYHPAKVSGFAFGIGIDRLAMLKYGIDDIQVFFQNDVRFLEQFP